MSASISLKASSVARGAGDNLAGSAFTPGRTIIQYVGGQYAGVMPTGEHDTVARGAISGIMLAPDSSRISTGAKTVTSKDATDGTTATTTLTLT